MRSWRTPRRSRSEREEELRADRERLRHVTELAEAAAAAGTALAPDDGQGAAELTAEAFSALDGVAGIADELDAAAGELRELDMRLRDVASTVKAYASALEADPGRLEHVEAELERLADLRRRYRVETTAELVERTAAARAELDALADGVDPVAASAEALEQAQRRADELVAALAKQRRALRRRSPRQSPPSWSRSAWGRASSWRSSVSASPPRAAPTR